jgi:hypothetical protein
MPPRMSRSHNLNVTRTSTPFDVVGVGLNATDTLLVVSHFPA